MLITSFNKVLEPEVVLSNPILLAILGLSVLVKAWMYSYNRYIGNTINSSMNRAGVQEPSARPVAVGPVLLGISNAQPAAPRRISPAARNDADAKPN